MPIWCRRSQSRLRFAVYYFTSLLEGNKIMHYVYARSLQPQLNVKQLFMFKHEYCEPSHDRLITQLILQRVIICLSLTCNRILYLRILQHKAYILDLCAQHRQSLVNEFHDKMIHSYDPDSLIYVLILAVFVYPSLKSFSYKNSTRERWPVALLELCRSFSLRTHLHIENIQIFAVSWVKVFETNYKDGR